MADNGYTEVFLFVAGTTPQIVTETIYALSRKEPPIYPDAIRIITTDVGRRHIEESLMRKGILERLLREYEIPTAVLAAISFMVPKSPHKGELKDIRDEEENEIMGDAIVSCVQEMTGDTSVRLHCSIAGGRKTMSFYMGAALQLFGRPWDKLYHVLVSPEFESNPSFFYKPKTNLVIETRSIDGTVKKLNTDDAEISLAELPFIRLREKLTLTGQHFRDLVAEGQREIDTATLQPEISVDLSERSLCIGDIKVRLQPLQLAFYTAFLKRKSDGCIAGAADSCGLCTDCFMTVNQFFTDGTLKEMEGLYSSIHDDDPFRMEELESVWGSSGDQASLFRQYRTKVNSSIKQQTGKSVHFHYTEIISVKNRRELARYGIKLDRNKIRFET